MLLPALLTRLAKITVSVARMAALLAGLPVTTGGNTVNRLCASGLQAIMDASRAIMCGEGKVYIAGGG